MPENDRYLTLTEAAKYLPHGSRGYLNILIRRNQLRAQKFGKFWYTKKEWVDEYLKARPKFHHLITTTFASGELRGASIQETTSAQIHEAVAELRQELARLRAEVVGQRRPKSRLNAGTVLVSVMSAVIAGSAIAGGSLLRPHLTRATEGQAVILNGSLDIAPREFADGVAAEIQDSLHNAAAAIGTTLEPISQAKKDLAIRLAFFGERLELKAALLDTARDFLLVAGQVGAYVH